MLIPKGRKIHRVQELDRDCFSEPQLISVRMVLCCDLSPHYSSDINQINKSAEFVLNISTVKMMSKLCTSELSPLCFSWLNEDLWQQLCQHHSVQQFRVPVYGCQFHSDLARTGGRLTAYCRTPIALTTGLSLCQRNAGLGMHGPKSDNSNGKYRNTWKEHKTTENYAASGARNRNKVIWKTLSEWLLIWVDRKQIKK